jgi:hypothetical protein
MTTTAPVSIVLVASAFAAHKHPEQMLEAPMFARKTGLRT